MWLAANVKRADELEINLGDDDENYPFRGPEVMRAIKEDPTDLQIGETDDLSGIQKQLDAMNPWATFEDYSIQIIPCSVNQSNRCFSSSNSCFSTLVPTRA